MDTQIVPSNPIVLDRWTDSLAEMDTFETKIVRLHDDAKALEVKDADSFARAGALIAELKHNTAESEACMEPFKLKVRRVLDFIQQRFNKNKNRAGEAHAILTVKMAAHSLTERQAAAAEEKKMNKKSAEPVTVAPNLPKTTGVRTTTNYPITIEDSKALVRAFAKAYKAGDTKRVQFLSRFITLDGQALREYAKDLKNPEQFNKEIPGVKCEAKEAFGGKV